VVGMLSAVLNTWAFRVMTSLFEYNNRPISSSSDDMTNHSTCRKTSENIVLFATRLCATSSGRLILHVASNIFSIIIEVYLIRVTPLEPKIWRWLLDYWKICGSLPPWVLRVWVRVRCINWYKRPTACKYCESAAPRRQLLAHVCGTGQRHW
jgi:hypothetical protein